jgi:predicted transcriptional regulator
MNVKNFRPVIALVALIAAFACSAMAASASSNDYCDPLGGCKTHFLKVSPSSVKAGRTTTVSGAVGNGCKVPGRVTVYSRAFKGATRQQFAGVPAILITTNRQGKFSKRVTIRRTIKAARYHVGARCGGGNLGSATLRVTKR